MFSTSRNFVRFVVVAVVLGTLSAGGCSSSGSANSASGALTTTGTVVDLDGNSHDLSSLVFTGGRMETATGEAGSFTVKKSTAGKVGDGIIDVAAATLGGWGGTSIARAAGGGTTGQIVGGVGGGAAGTVVGQQLKTPDNQMVWVLLSQPGLEKFASPKKTGAVANASN